MVRYYYYMTMTGLLDEESPRSMKVIGLYRSATIPLPPIDLRGEGVSRGVRLQWNAAEKEIIGFYVFRGMGRNRLMTQISSLIPLNEKEMWGSYLDTSTVLSGKINYAYSVRAESKSHVLGAYTDTIFVRPNIPTVPLTPVKLNVLLDGKTIRLFWQDMRQNDATIIGYDVFRRVVPGTKSQEWKKLNSSILNVTKNYYDDIAVEEGKSYEYAVRSIDVFGGKSSLSSIKCIEIPVDIPPAPGGIRLERTDKGVLIRWGPVKHPNVSSFKVLRTQYQGKATVVATVKDSVTECLDAKIKSGQLYFYRIITVLSNGRESVPSKEISIRP